MEETDDPGTLVDDAAAARARAKGRAALEVVLLVERDADARAATASLLREAGCTVVEAADAREAIVLLGAGVMPELIVVDRHIPSTNGWDLWAFLRERPHLRDATAVVWTEREADLVIGPPPSALPPP